MIPSNDANQVRASPQARPEPVREFSETVGKELAAHPEGLTVDELYDALRRKFLPPLTSASLSPTSFPSSPPS